MTIKPIKTKRDYQAALARLETIFDSTPGTAEGDELEVLGILIDKYEMEHYPIGYPDPIEAIKFRMEQMGYTQNDLAKVVGLKSRASEILNKKRKLSLEMIRQLHQVLKIPTDVLIQSFNKALQPTLACHNTGSRNSPLADLPGLP
jgi:HTH-type transcriptional regulator / antitoxin HigA